MTSFVYPNNILGLSFGVHRAYEWTTGKQEALSKKRSTIAYQLYPDVHFELSYELLRDDLTPSDVKALVGLFNACSGSFDTFLFTDPDFNTITPATAAQYGVFGIGDGTTNAFQLAATYQNLGGPGNDEIVQNLNGTPILYDNGTTISAANYSIGATGIVTFTAGHTPAAGHTLTWSGGFYYRCAFDEDKFDVEKFLNLWWKSKVVAFTSIKL